MGHFVISYARENRSQQELLVRHLRRLGHTVFVDVDLAGSVAWWEKVLSEIRSCDAVVAILSAASLNSVACSREWSYAFALGKPILPVAVEPLTQALPRNLSLINVVDYSQPGEDSAFALAAAVGSLPPPEKLPSPLPPDPEPPLSYLTDLVDAVQSPGELTGEQQFHLLDRLEPALTSADPEERQGGLLILHKLASRPELRAGVEHRIHALEPASAPVDARPSPAAPAESRPSAPSGDRSVPDAGRGPALPMPIPPVGQKKRSKVMTALAVLGVIFLVLLVLAFCSSNGNDPYYYGLGALLLVPPGVSNVRQ